MGILNNLGEPRDETKYYTYVHGERQKKEFLKWFNEEVVPSSSSYDTELRRRWREEGVLPEEDILKSYELLKSSPRNSFKVFEKWRTKTQLDERDGVVVLTCLKYNELSPSFIIPHLSEEDMAYLKKWLYLVDSDMFKKQGVWVEKSDDAVAERAAIVAAMRERRDKASEPAKTSDPDERVYKPKKKGYDFSKQTQEKKESKRQRKVRKARERQEKQEALSKKHDGQVSVGLDLSAFLKK